MPEGPLLPSDLIAGTERFNRGDYFEAHEEWEKTWYGREGEEGRFLKGLIQVAVSLHHLEEGNLRGARKVMGTALGYLKEFPSHHAGADLRSEEHTSELQSHRDLHSFPTRRSSDLLHHLEEGNLRGARKVMGTALGYLKEFPSHHAGADL